MCNHSNDQASTYEFLPYCGAKVCTVCDDHKGLVRCFCGFSRTSPGRGRQELVEDGETIDAEDY